MAETAGSPRRSTADRSRGSGAGAARARWRLLGQVGGARGREGVVAGRRAERGFHSRWRGAVARRAQLRVVPMVLGFFRVFVSLEFVNCLQQNGAVG